MKYIYIHGHDAQLFDLENDPGEWHSLVDDPAHQAVADDLLHGICSHLDPEAIERDVRVSLERRMVIEEAMAVNET